MGEQERLDLMRLGARDHFFRLGPEFPLYPLTKVQQQIIDGHLALALQATVVHHAGQEIEIVDLALEGGYEGLDRDAPPPFSPRP